MENRFATIFGRKSFLSLVFFGAENKTKVRQSDADGTCPQGRLPAAPWLCAPVPVRAFDLLSRGPWLNMRILLSQIARSLAFLQHLLSRLPVRSNPSVLRHTISCMRSSRHAYI